MPLTETKLLPCPFCGNEPETDYEDVIIVSCSNSKCCVAQATFNLEQWNTRTPLPEPKELEKDKERLDWLDNQNYFESVGYFIFQRRADKPLRTAIDNTMKKPQYVQ